MDYREMVIIKLTFNITFIIDLMKNYMDQD